ncbi:MAG TPA: chlorophyll synthesis pathway protein BchC [Geobacterales bacterium]|nr:chlorophyll synthesis pathway protein BchC [Geobacterales bacterium]
METLAVVLQEPQQLGLQRLQLPTPGDADLVVDVEWSGISTGTERLLWSGRMPDFPGMGYPLVPGYESVGRVSWAGSSTKIRVGERVFVPGANCYGAIRGLFGGTASRVVLPESRTIPIAEELGEKGILFALGATAYHAAFSDKGVAADLIVGHGVLGRLIARIVIASGAPAPMVWEKNTSRFSGAVGYQVIDPDQDPRRDYRVVCDVSGDSSILDALVSRLAPGGEIILAGFYADRLSFSFPPAFMKEARIRIAAQWQKADMLAVKQLVDSGRLSFDGLITHRSTADGAPSAYRVAFEDPACLKMVLDWRKCV